VIILLSIIVLFLQIQNFRCIFAMLITRGCLLQSDLKTNINILITNLALVVISGMYVLEPVSSERYHARYWNLPELKKKYYNSGEVLLSQLIHVTKMIVVYPVISAYFL
jgi:hypothetical protein